MEFKGNLAYLSLEERKDTGFPSPVPMVPEFMDEKNKEISQELVELDQARAHEETALPHERAQFAQRRYGIGQKKFILKQIARRMEIEGIKEEDIPRG